MSESELVLRTAKWLGGKLWWKSNTSILKEKASKASGTSLSAPFGCSSFRRFLFFSYSGSLPAFWLLCVIRAVVPCIFIFSKLWPGQYRMSQNPTYQRPVTDRCHPGLPHSNPVHHNSQIEPFWKLSRSWHQSLRTAQTTSFLLFPDSVASPITSL